MRDGWDITTGGSSGGGGIEGGGVGGIDTDFGKKAGKGAGGRVRNLLSRGGGSGSISAPQPGS